LFFVVARIILALLVFGAVVAILKLVLLALVLAGLIWRTKETIGLLLFGGMLTLAGKYPLIGWPLLIIVVVVAIAKAMRSDTPDDGSTALERLDRLLEENKRQSD